jgi:hypothetical protein
MKRHVVNIKESINLSEKVQTNVRRSVNSAEDQIKKDEDSLKLMQKIEDQKVNINDIEDKKRLES